MNVEKIKGIKAKLQIESNRNNLLQKPYASWTNEGTNLIETINVYTHLNKGHTKTFK